MPIKKVVVFVHGWSVTNTDTYGGLPIRLREQANTAGIDIQVEEIFLGRYISFHDEVRVSDISKAFRAAVKDQLSGILQAGTRFVCITHSTGGPVIRDWWHRYYETVSENGICPMSHLVMLAPANYGSALAQLGKGRLSRLKFWFGGVEPGQGVLDWLELGSAEAWNLNTNWIRSGESQIGTDGVFPFVLTGQYIDRAFYDNINAYTGEIGSDGVVRVAAANLCGTYIKLVQEAPRPKLGEDGEFIADELKVELIVEAPKTAFRVISGKSHSGEEMGIMRSVNVTSNDEKSQETFDAILACIKVQTNAQYKQLCEQFATETENVQKSERLEVETRFFLTHRYFIHDKFSMMIFRVRDNEDHPVTDYDLILTDGPNADPNHLPEGFFVDRQRNHVNPETLTYFFNYDVMKGTEAILDKDGKVIREAMNGAETLGFKIVARPDKGFVHYLPCEFKATREMLMKALHRNSTTLVDIRLQRVVRKNVFRIDEMTSPTIPVDFKKTLPGNEIVE
ncbi:MAG: phospholipase [Nitrospirae bacterium]|nr:phospholipase [Nitrospirota bacterium]